MRDSLPVRAFADIPREPLKLVREAQASVLPPNPALHDGVRVLYLGTTRRRVEGAETGYVYFADPFRREFEVAPADLPSVLAHRAFVLAH
ncbi:MAG TPA: hypothetical protein VFV33_22200 [Gemmatimonadaceae bacterium]|nr:hypothetical protein [Gemmatimonadaceae bacterium]